MARISARATRAFASTPATPITAASPPRTAAPARTAAHAVGIVVVAAAAMAALAACSSPTVVTPQPADTPGPSAGQLRQDEVARMISAPALLAQCAISDRVPGLLASARDYNAGSHPGQRWLHGTKVELTFASAAGFTDWLGNDGGAAIRLGGKPLSDWQQWAATNDELPAQVCGTTITAAEARKLYDRIYAGWPGMVKDDHW